MDGLRFCRHGEAMNWDDLRIFLAVARGRTLSAAGRRLGLDATTVARRLARLEAETGRSLFEVTPAGHIPTARGQELLGHVQAMESAAIACKEGAHGAQSAGGTVRVSVAEGFGTSVIAPHLHEFADAHPGIGVELVASSGFLNLSRREADLAVMLAGQGPRGLRALLASEFPTAAFAVIDVEAETWGGVAPGRGRLEHFVRPRDIDPDLAG